MTDTQDNLDAVANELQKVAAEHHDGAIVTTFVAAAEVIGADGHHYLHFLHQAGSTLWTHVGMAQSLADMLRARMQEDDD